MPMTLHEHTLVNYEVLLRDWHARGAILKCTFLHHCLSPNAHNYNGLSSIKSVQWWHINKRHGHDIFCSLYTTPDGTVVPARPPTSNNCACQAPPPRSPFSALHPHLQQLIGAGNPYWRSWPNKYGFSVETVGNFDWPTRLYPYSEDPTTSVAMATSLDALAMVHEIWDLPVERCFFHRDIRYFDEDFKQCPGERVSKAWVHDELRRRLNVPSVEVVIKETIERPVDCDVTVVDGTARCNLRKLANALGYDVDGETEWPTILLTRMEV